MIALDMRTIIFSYVLTDIVCLMVIVLLWRQSRNRLAGSFFWVFNFAFQVAALFLVVLRGSIPDWTSIVLANTLAMTGALLGYMALARFVGQKSFQIHNYILLAVFAFIHAYFTFVHPDQAVRNLNISFGLLFICFQCAWLMLYRVESGMRSLTRIVGIVFAVYCLISVVRIIEFFAGAHSQSDYLQSGTFEKLAMISYQMLFILLTYGLALMFNKRLLLDITTEEEKFSKAFHSSPYAIIITRLSDGQIVEVNAGFLNITGYQLTEVKGKTTPVLHLWDTDEDRVLVINELVSTGKMEEREFQFRKKSGEKIMGLFSAEIIAINNEKCVLASINDITERKKMESDLLRNEAFTRAVMDNLPIGVAVNSVDPAVSFTYMNDNFPRYYRTTKEALANPDGFWEAVYEDAVFREMSRKRILDDCASGDPDRMHWEDVPLARKGEETTFFSARNIPIPGEPLMISTVWDVTERKQAQEEIIKKARDLERFNNLMIGRELTMVELKKEINELLKRSGEKEKYRIVEKGSG